MQRASNCQSYPYHNIRVAVVIAGDGVRYPVFLHILVSSVWRSMMLPSSALLAPVSAQVSQVFRPELFQLSRIIRFVLIPLPSFLPPPLSLSPSVRARIMLHCGNLNGEEVFLWPPKFIRLFCRSTIFSPGVLGLWPWRSFIVSPNVFCILSCPPLSFVMISSI